MAHESPVVVTDHLSERERLAYEKHLAAKDPPLSVFLVAQMYELYLATGSLVEVAKANPGIRLGGIVRAALENDWWRMREEYITALLRSITDRTVQVQSEAVVFVGKLLAVTHKLHGQKLDTFLQTGKEEVLGGMRLDSLEQYRKACELMLKLTGQDREPRMPRDPANPKEAGTGPAPEHPVISSPSNVRALLPDEAAVVLAALQAAKDTT